MKDSNLDLFDPRTAVMESAAYSPTSSSRDPDFGFAFDDSNFSDRILRIEVLADDSSETHSGTDACQTLADWARYRKRPREDVKKHDGIPLFPSFNICKFFLIGVLFLHMLRVFL